MLPFGSGPTVLEVSGVVCMPHTLQYLYVCVCVCVFIDTLYPASNLLSNYVP